MREARKQKPLLHSSESAVSGLMADDEKPRHISISVRTDRPRPEHPKHFLARLAFSSNLISNYPAVSMLN